MSGRTMRLISAARGPVARSRDLAARAAAAGALVAPRATRG
ncbi:MAG: hypothetical protein M5U08_23375 [Burkholderiales bacterium]|nr:hypothetical protein [Burkholderiales bacterium]